MNMTYAGTGVNYDVMDPFKRAAQLAARTTTNNIERWDRGGSLPDFCEVEASRGESVYLIETPHNYLAHVEEGLGTKNLVADAMYALTGKPYYSNVAQCTCGHDSQRYDYPRCITALTSNASGCRHFGLV